MVGERSRGELKSETGVGGSFDSSWTGIVSGSPHTGWRVVGWTGEPPNHDPGLASEVHFHGFAQFNSDHMGGVTVFVFADGSVHRISEDVDPEVFKALGSIRGGEVVPPID